MRNRPRDVMEATVYVMQKALFYRVGMRTTIDLHMKYMRDRLLVKTSRKIFNEAEQEWENNCGLGE